MKSLRDAIIPVLSGPTPDALVALQGALLAAGQTGEDVDHALEIAGQFHAYLTELQSKIAARDYSELASRPDTKVRESLDQNALAAAHQRLIRRLEDPEYRQPVLAARERG